MAYDPHSNVNPSRVSNSSRAPRGSALEQRLASRMRESSTPSYAFCAVVIHWLTVEDFYEGFFTAENFTNRLEINV